MNNPPFVGGLPALPAQQAVGLAGNSLDKPLAEIPAAIQELGCRIGHLRERVEHLQERLAAVSVSHPKNLKDGQTTQRTYASPVASDIAVSIGQVEILIERLIEIHAELAL